MIKITRFVIVIIAVLVLSAALQAAEDVKEQSSQPEVASGEPPDLDKMIEFQSTVETRWRIQDVVTANIKNTLSRQLKGNLVITFPGAKPEKRRFSVRPGKSEKIEFKPEIVWDGRSSLTADAVVTCEGFDSPVTRKIDLGTSHRVHARAACPIGRVLEVRIASPAKNKASGKLKLYGVKGIKPQDTMARFEVEGQTVVSFTLTEPAPKEFAFGMILIDATAKDILRTPVLNYTIIEDFSGATDGAPPVDYSLVTDGNAGKVSAECSTRDTAYTAVRNLPICRLKYDLLEGQGPVRMVPGKFLPLKGRPLELGYWIYADGASGDATCRLVGPEGRLLESKGFSLDQREWRYRVMSFEDADTVPSGWDSLLVISSGGKNASGTIYLGPIMMVSEQVEQPKDKQEPVGAEVI